MTPRFTLIAFALALAFSGCDKDEEFSCNGKGQFKINSDQFCATAINVLNRTEWTTGEKIDLGISATGLDLRLSAESRGTLIQENKEYAYVYGGSYSYPPAYFTVLASAGINTVSVWVTFTKYDRANKMVSGTFRATWLDIDGVGKPTSNEITGRFDDIPYDN